MQIFWSYETLRHQRYQKSTSFFVKCFCLFFNLKKKKKKISKSSKGSFCECIQHIMEETQLTDFMLEHLSSSATEGSVKVETHQVDHYLI